MFCNQCLKLSILNTKKICVKCSKEIVFNISCICDQCSEIEQVCAACLKKMPGSKLASNKLGQGTGGCNCGKKKKK